MMVIKISENNDVPNLLIHLNIYLLNEPAHDKTYNKTCVTNKDRST